MSTETEALERAIAIKGSQSALARAVGKKQAHVWYWLNKGQVPAEIAPKIEAATGGQVSKENLRPDVFGPAPTSTPSEAA